MAANAAGAAPDAPVAMMLRRFRARYGRLLEWLVGALPWGARRIVNIAAQLVVIAFFVVLGTVGVANMPILSGDSMVSLPWVPMNFVQSVIPVSSALIVIAEVAHLLELLAASVPP